MLAPSTERHLPEEHRVHGGGALNRADPLWYSHCIKSGNNSVVECDLAKVEVAGSNPVSRSIFHLHGGWASGAGRAARSGPEAGSRVSMP